MTDILQFVTKENVKLKTHQIYWV